MAPQRLTPPEEQPALLAATQGKNLRGPTAAVFPVGMAGPAEMTDEQLWFYITDDSI